MDVKYIIERNTLSFQLLSRYLTNPDWIAFAKENPDMLVQVGFMGGYNQSQQFLWKIPLKALFDPKRRKYRIAYTGERVCYLQKEDFNDFS